MIRPATLADVKAIVELAVESVSRNPLPVRVSRDHMTETAVDLIGKPNHFVWVHEADGKITTCVAACTQVGFWFERQQCSVLLFYGSHVARLLARLAAWIKSRPVIKLAVIEFEPEVDQRLITFCHKLGFRRHSQNLTYVRSAQ